MIRLALYLLVGALAAPAVWAAPAQVGSWARACQTGQTTASLKGGGWACYTPTGSDTESASPALDVTSCENVDVFLFVDADGDDSSCTVTWDIEMCPPGSNALATNAIKNFACQSLPGITALGADDPAGDDVESNLAGTHIRVHGQAAGANLTECTVIVKCAEAGE